MPLSVYQNMVNQIVGLPIPRCSGTFVNVLMWEHCTFDCEIFRRSNVNYSNCIIINNFVETYILSCRLEYVFHACSCIEIFYQNFHVIFM
jgi:hypothetical protein